MSRLLTTVPLLFIFNSLSLTTAFAANSNINSLLTLSLNSFTGVQAGTTSVTQTAPPGSAYSAITIALGSSFLATNICSTATIFGLTGTASCSTSGTQSLVLINSDLASDAMRTSGTTQLSLAAEVGTDAGLSLASLSGYTYRNVPASATDTDGNQYNTSGVHDTTVTNVILNSSRPTSNCGEPLSMSGTSLKSSLVADRITHCQTINGTSAKWDGTVNGNAGQSLWYLVTRLGTQTIGTATLNNEVWQDQRTGLLWSSLVSSSLNTWCKASGSSQNTSSGDTYCSSNAVSYCSEGLPPASANDGTSGAWDGSTYSAQKGGMGSSGYPVISTATFPAIRWRLPTLFDYEQADIDGLRFVMPDAIANFPILGPEWTATSNSQSSSHSQAFQFIPGTGAFVSSARSGSTAYGRCVGH